MSKEVMEMRRLAGLPLNENYVYAQEEDDTPEPSTEQPEAHEPTPDDKAEYDQEGRMEKNHLSTMIDAAKELEKLMQDNENLPEWVQDKITMATDYIDTVRDYMKSNDAEYTDEGAVNEEPNEGNEFSGELAKAKAAGKKEFEVDGKSYPVKEAKAKPDFPDVDGDGNTKEPITKAVKDKKEKTEESIKADLRWMQAAAGINVK